jgi:DNA (cytosine-5)-methyltransferase 1
MNELALFAGAGGGILGGKLLGWRTICAVEWESYPASVLCARQNEGLLPPFPIWDDIQTFDGKPWRGIVDVVSGGFPCQDISAAGRGDGLDGERSGMWKHMARVVGEVRPRFVFVENSPMLTSRGGVRVIADLTSLGYDCRWTVMGAADVGAPHQRDRIWIVAKQRHILSHPQHDWNGWGEQQSQSPTQEVRDVANPKDEGNVWREWELGFAQQEHHSGGSQAHGGREWWATEPDVGRVADGVAARVDRLKAIGNGQVPLCAASAWRLLTQGWDVI